ncbi:hypothetical protein [Chryseobacterium gregarium]|uniref:hypothetical protein n=1 Tax=Chryseobacterium gregarium TaxID=456299 RepID=UPI00042469EA|nr:hypothetical protein [Chryseobacterium gregarium]
MILGVYWYYKFPEGLYHFDFFRFLKGFGGHADNPAQLQASVSVSDTESFLLKITTLKSEYKRAYLTVKKNGNCLFIETRDYTLFDYHFQLVSEVEKLLKDENAQLIEDKISFDMGTNYSFDADYEGIYDKKKHDFIQLVGSDFKKCNAENVSMRIDGHLPSGLKREFLHDLTQICLQENISVFYYFDFEADDFVNLMLFFTNGRQTKDHIQIINIISFGDKIRKISEKYTVWFGHKNGLGYYPVNGPHIQLMDDEEFIIGTTLS